MAAAFLDISALDAAYRWVGFRPASDRVLASGLCAALVSRLTMPRPPSAGAVAHIPQKPMPPSDGHALAMPLCEGFVWL